MCSFDDIYNSIFISELKKAPNATEITQKLYDHIVKQEDLDDII